MAEITLNYSKGLNADADHMTCPPSQIIRSQEFFQNYGTLITRSQCPIINNAALSAVNIDHVTAWQDPAQVQTPTRYLVVALTNNKAFTGTWTSDNNIETGTKIAFTDRTNAVSVGKFPCTSDVLNGNLVICTNNSPPVTLTTYNGNIAALGGSPPTGVCVKVVNNFMFIAGTFFTGTSSILSRVYWSNVGDPTTWNAGSNLDYRVNDGDFIIALGALGQNLVIFKTNSIGLLATTTQSVSGIVTLGPLTTLFNGVGCCSPCAVDNLPDGRLAFLGSDMCLYLTDGTNLFNASKRSYPQQSVDSILRGNWLGTLGVVNFPVVKVSPSDHEIWILPQSSTTGSAGPAAIYDYYQDTWSYSAANSIQCMATLGPARAAQTGGFPYRAFFGTGDSSGNLRLLQNTQDDGTLPVGTASFSIQLVKELANFTPRSVVIPATLTQGQATVSFGFNGVTDANYSYTLSSSVLRNVLPVKYPYGTNSVRPISFQIVITNTGSKNKFYPITISDEVLS